jgi:hypothetical protein
LCLYNVLLKQKKKQKQNETKESIENLCLNSLVL